MSEGADESAERSTALVHVAKSLLPAEKLAPWMTALSNRMCVLTATMTTIADLGDELEKRMWMDEQTEKKNGHKPKGPKDPTEAKEPTNPDPIGDVPEEEFFVEDRRGPLTIISTFNRSFVRNLYNVMPSEKGLRAKQAMYFGSAQKTGIAYEPKPRSRWEKLTGKGKDRSQISGVE